MLFWPVVQSPLFIILSTSSAMCPSTEGQNCLDGCFVPPYDVVGSTIQVLLSYKSLNFKCNSYCMLPTLILMICMGDVENLSEVNQ